MSSRRVFAHLNGDAISWPVTTTWTCAGRTLTRSTSQFNISTRSSVCARRYENSNRTLSCIAVERRAVRERFGRVCPVGLLLRRKGEFRAHLSAAFLRRIQHVCGANTILHSRHTTTATWRKFTTTRDNSQSSWRNGARLGKFAQKRTHVLIRMISVAQVVVGHLQALSLSLPRRPDACVLSCGSNCV